MDGLIIGLSLGTWCVVMWIAYKCNTRVNDYSTYIDFINEQIKSMNENIMSLSIRANHWSDVARRNEETIEKTIETIEKTIETMTFTNDSFNTIADSNNKRYNQLFIDLETTRAELTQLRKDMECYIVDLRNTMKTKPATFVKKPTKK